MVKQFWFLLLFYFLQAEALLYYAVYQKERIQYMKNILRVLRPLAFLKSVKSSFGERLFLVKVQVYTIYLFILYEYRETQCSNIYPQNPQS